jgi:hopanoid-associated phosphorylase
MTARDAMTLAPAAAALPVIVVSGMAFEARIARGHGVETVYASRGDLLERALSDAVARGASGILSFGTAGGLAPALDPGTIVVAEAVDGPFGRLDTDPEWTERIEAALAASPLAAKLQIGVQAAVAAPLVNAQDKAALHRASGALAVDMDSHLAGAIAKSRGLPFAVCRAIVDPAGLSLPSAATAGFGEDGKTALGPILRELLRQPSQLGALIRLAGDAKAAKASLVQARHAIERTGALRPV